MKLSDHFSLDEFTRSRTASIHGIVNQPSDTQIEVIRGLCVAVLEKARGAVGPIQVTSGYRCPKLNGMVLGEPNSDHMILGHAAAADLVVPAPGMGYLFALLSTLPWSRLIWEYGGEWIHVSWSADGRPEGRRPQRKDYGKPYRAMEEAEITALVGK
jgi:zinc D-Ala-D-Ala carboxypeptidase